jgi:uncharacterized protein (TIGR03067 family)
MMTWKWLIVGISGLLLAADTPKEDSKKELDRIQGSWVATSGESAGAPLPDEQVKEMKFVIKENKYSYAIAGAYQEKGTLKIDSSKKPKAIDVAITEGEDQGETQLGIYEVDKDTLKFCFARPGKDKKRPKSFRTTAEDEQLLIVFKREKS